MRLISIRKMEDSSVCHSFLPNSFNTNANLGLLIATNWVDPADDQRVADFSTGIIDKIQQKAEAAGLSYPLHNLNDAGPGTDVFSKYGGGSSLPVMKATREKYGILFLPKAL